MQQQFSSETSPTVWKVLPVIENFMQEWQDLAADNNYAALAPAINSGLKTTEKYFGKAMQSSAQIMNLCTCMHLHLCPSI